MQTSKQSKQSAFWKRFTTAQSPEAEKRRNLRAVMNNVILHVHPAHVPAKALRFSYTWGLGGIGVLLVLILGLTGALLTFRYVPDVDEAYLSIQVLETQVAFGSLLRGLHHWSANLLVIVGFLHLLRVFLTGGFKKGRRLNWVIGLIIFILIVIFNFTGYLLPWDQLAYWAVTVSSSMIHHIPLVGQALSNALLGGPEVGQGALSNFYALHVAVLPATTIAFLLYHFWRVRRDGGISQPEKSPGEKVERVTTVPNLVQREVGVAAIIISGLVIFSMLVPAPLGEVANPLRSPNPAKAAWYLGGIQELLLHMETPAALFLLTILLGLVLVFPIIDKHDADIGLYFRSKVGRQSALLGTVLSVNLIPLLILADELWIDWVAMFPTWPTIVSNGFVPVFVILVLLALTYGLARWLLKANRSEAILAVFTFVMVSFIILTISCAFFRGENMDLVLPGSM